MASASVADPLQHGRSDAGNGYAKEALYANEHATD
jgi:hypothetical protein